MILVIRRMFNLVNTMAHKYKYIFILFLLPLIYLKISHHYSHKKYIFINETNDHRFDESIRMSILSAQMRTNVQNAVIITNRNEIILNIDQIAPRLFKQLHLGEKNFGRAILYLYSPEKKTLKIEVGYQLESRLTDAKLKSLELAAKTFTYTERMQDFWAELINTINIEISNNDRKEINYASNFDFSKFSFNSGGAGIFSNNYQGSWDQFLKESNSIRQNNKYLSHIDINIAIKNYLESLQDGIGSSDLNILSQESKFFRTHTLFSSFQLFRNFSMYQKAGIKKIIICDKLAFVFFNTNIPVLPIILKKVDTLWFVNEPLSWALFQRFENSNQVSIKFPLTGFGPEFENYIKLNFNKPVYELDKKLRYDEFITLDFGNQFKDYMLKFYWPEKIKYIMNSTSLNQLSNDELKFVSDAYMNLGEVSHFLNAYAEIAKRQPNNITIQHNLAFYLKTLVFNENEWQTRF